MNTSDRLFFTKLRKAAFANPFGPERESVDLEISGLEKTSDGEAVLSKLLDEVLVRINSNKKNANKLSGEDRLLFRYGSLFYTFHLFCDAYDALISEQIKEGEKSIKVSFAGDVLQYLVDFGFSSKEAVRFFGFFFQLRRGFYFINGITGQSPSVKKLRQALWNNIFTNDVQLYEQFLWNRMEDFSTILLGETGTGKGMAAAAIGRSGYIPFNEKNGCFNDSFSRTFISINLSQFSEHLIESELFGHTKGAFTGATGNHVGVFSRCSPHGAIFLDEIGEVSIPVQIKLLQVLQERIFSPVGSHNTEKFQGRVIAATNQPLSQLRRKKKFRDDFYYRLCSDTIELPSLKQRLDEHPDELQEILTTTLRRILGHGSKPLAKDICKIIRQTVPHNYMWPGNIRELEQCVRQILLNRSYCWDQRPDVLESLSEFQKRFNSGGFTATELLAKYCSHLYKQHGTYEKVSSIVQLDRRTVKKYIEMTQGSPENSKTYTNQIIS